MKKLLSALSLLLVTVMFFSIVPASAKTVNPWKAPEGIDIYYATDLTDTKNAPTIDGVISYNEYGDPIASFGPDDCLTFGGQYPECDSNIDDTRVDQPASDNIDFYVAFDEDYIYIAINDLGGTWEDGDPIYEWLEEELTKNEQYSTKIAGFAARNNYQIYTGFYLNNVGDMLAMQCSSRGFDENKWYMSGSVLASGGQWTYPDSIVEDAYIRKTLVEDGSVIVEAPGGYCKDVDASGNQILGGNNNTYVGQYNAVIELKYSKVKLIELMNELYMDAMVELPNAMWLRFVGRTYPVKVAADTDGNGGSTWDQPYLGYNNYFVKDARVENKELEYNAEDYLDYGLSASSDFMYSLVVFGDENTELSEGRWEGDPGDTDCIFGRHNQTNVQKKYPTCSDAGSIDYYCDVCDNYYTESYGSPIGHTADVMTKTIVEPTCTESGVLHFSCVYCDYNYSYTYADPLGHIYDDMNGNMCTRCFLEKPVEFEYDTETLPVETEIPEEEESDVKVTIIGGVDGVQEYKYYIKGEDGKYYLADENGNQISDEPIDGDHFMHLDPTVELQTQANVVVSGLPNLGFDLNLGGCAGTVSIAGLALVTALGTCAVLVSKKKD